MLSRLYPRRVEATSASDPLPVPMPGVPMRCRAADAHLDHRYVRIVEHL
jgi:hypothetical protein